MADEETCKVCVKKVLNSEDGLQCDSDCKNWFHIKCIGMTKSEYTQYANNVNKKWFCSRMDCSPTAANLNNRLLTKMDEILNKFSSLATKEELKNLATGIEGIQSQLDNLGSKFEDFEPRIENLEQDVAQMKADIKANKSKEMNPESVIEELNERKRRSCNVIAHNLPESKSSSPNTAMQHDKNLVENILNKANLGVLLPSARSFRIGNRNGTKPRPLKICLPSEKDAITIFRSFGDTTHLNEALKGISLSRDRTQSERHYLNDLRETLKVRTEAGEPDLTIKYINGTPKIIKKKN